MGPRLCFSMNSAGVIPVTFWKFLQAVGYYCLFHDNIEFHFCEYILFMRCPILRRSHSIRLLEQFIEM